jgi:hypothetical protein
VYAVGRKIGLERAKLLVSVTEMENIYWWN